LPPVIFISVAFHCRRRCRFFAAAATIAVSAATFFFFAFIAADA
jgi:hypothetical protein